MTVRLAHVALNHWADVDGLAVSQGLPELGDMPLDRFTNFIWWWATRNAQSSEEVEDFRRRLWKPPPGEVGRGPWAPAEETESFQALKRGLGL